MLFFLFFDPDFFFFHKKEGGWDMSPIFRSASEKRGDTGYGLTRDDGLRFGQLKFMLAQSVILL